MTNNREVVAYTQVGSLPTHERPRSLSRMRYVVTCNYLTTWADIEQPAQRDFTCRHRHLGVGGMTEFHGWP